MTDLVPRASSSVTPVRPWDRQIGEPYVWWTRFEQYRLMGPERSVRAVFQAETQRRVLRQSLQRGDTFEQAQKLAQRPVAKYPPSSWQEAAKQYQWGDRAEAWDAFQIAEEERSEREVRQQARKDRVALARAILARVAEGIQVSGAPRRWPEITFAFRTAAEQLRKDMGDEPSQRHEVTGSQGGPVRITLALDTPVGQRDIQTPDDDE